MLFKPEDLVTESYDPIQEAANILNESVYLDESESLLAPMAVPVVTNERIGAHVVAFDDVERLAEDHGIDYIDAMVAVAEANQIEMDKLAVSVPEWKIIADPEVVNELSNVVVAPISQNHPIYQFCETCVDLALDEDESGYLDAFVYAILEAVDETDWSASGIKKASAERNSGGLKGAAKTSHDTKQINDANNNRHNAMVAKNKIFDGAASDIAAIEKALKNGSITAEEAAKKKQQVNEWKQKELDKINKDTNNASVPSEKPKTGTRLPEEETDWSQAAMDKNKKDGGHSGASPETAQTKTLLEKIKYYGWDTPKAAISSAISSLKTQYKKLKDWAAKTDDQGKRSILQKFIGLITSAISKLTGFLSKKSDDKAA